MSLELVTRELQGREEASTGTPATDLSPAQLHLRGMVLDSVTSAHSRRNYAKAPDLLFALAAGRPLTRALLMEYRTSMEGLAPSTVDVRLSAVRKLVTEARKNGMLSAEEASNLPDPPNIRQKETQMGNWFTREQARELLQAPDRSTLKENPRRRRLPSLTAVKCLRVPQKHSVPLPPVGSKLPAAQLLFANRIRDRVTHSRRRR